MKTEANYIFSMSPVHCSQDLQVIISANITLKLGLTVLFTYLKIILLQYFKFSVISSIQIDPIYVLNVCLGSIYFAKTKIFLLKVL